MSKTLEELRQKYKRGWYRKGKTYRYLFALNIMGFLMYQTKTDKKKNSKKVHGINAACNDWFDKAEYIGLELKEEER